MWSDIEKQISVLSALDKSNQIFGAESHRYEFGASLSEAQIEDVEKSLGIELPHELRSYYLELGNGVVGPYYGLVTLENISGYQQDSNYPGLEYFKNLASEQGELFEDGYFEMDHDDLQGLITVIHEGGGHEICLISSGEKAGKVVRVSCNGYVHETNQSLLDLYKAWLDANLVAFEEIQRLIDTNNTMSEIYEICKEKLNRYDARDLVVSFLGVEKPRALFGAGNHKRYHGASQFPWYEKQLENYRARAKKPWWKRWLDT